MVYSLKVLQEVSRDSAQACCLGSCGSLVHMRWVKLVRAPWWELLLLLIYDEVTYHPRGFTPVLQQLYLMLLLLVLLFMNLDRPWCMSTRTLDSCATTAAAAAAAVRWRSSKKGSQTQLHAGITIHGTVPKRCRVFALFLFLSSYVSPPEISSGGSGRCSIVQHLRLVAFLHFSIF